MMECDLGGSLDTSIRCGVTTVCACVLIYKKSIEGQERGWDDFGFDVSKQAAGALWARLLEELLLGGEPSDCSALWLRILLDATLALAVELFLLCLAVSLVRSVCGDAGDFATGLYWHADGGFSAEKYVKQLGLWFGCVFCAKWLMYRLLSHWNGMLQAASGSALELVAWSAHL